LLDIVGFIDGDAFTPYQGSPNPIRIMDTRSGAKPTPGQTDCVVVGNPGDVALTNSTIVEPSQPGFATVGPSGYNWNAYSTNNYGAGGASPNLTATKIGPDGKLCTTAQQSAHKLLDIVGFIDGDAFTPYQGSPNPIRIMDTRSGVGVTITPTPTPTTTRPPYTGGGGGNCLPSQMVPIGTDGVGNPILGCP
jgi:hypothetical protein